MCGETSTGQNTKKKKEKQQRRALRFLWSVHAECLLLNHTEHMLIKYNGPYSYRN